MAGPVTPLAPADAARLADALALLRVGDAPAAQAQLDRLGPAARGHPDALMLAGIVAERRGDATAARRAFEAAVAAAPGHPGVLVRYADFLDSAGEARAAIAVYHRALALAPQLLEAWLNLAITAIGINDWREARAALDAAARIAPGDARVPAALGLVEEGEDRLAAAAAAYRAALAANPGDGRSRHNLAVVLRRSGDPAAALAAVDAALRAGVAGPETATLRGHVLADLGAFDAAVDQYRAVIAAAPDHLDAQAQLAQLLPQLGRRDEALAGYAAALARAPSPQLSRAALAAARAIGDGEAMLAWAAAAEAAHGPAPDWTLARVAALGLLGQPHAAIAAAAAADPASAGVQNHLAHLNLQIGELALAERHALAATRLAPLEQSPWALLTVIWRLLGDPREQWLIDYDRHVMVAELAPPPGWRDLGAFLADLAGVLTGLHSLRAAPAEQSLRGGTQTRETLFARRDPVLQALHAQLLVTIEQCLAGLPQDAAHPFLGRSTGAAAITGSWSVRLKSEGFHISHIHPEGWLSSACYVSVPPEIGGDAAAGKLLFGVPEAALGLDLSPRRLVTPVPGRLVLFPSYVWHGTAPFVSASERLTVAFDALPRPRAA